MRLYLDTDIWNALCDSQVSPQILMQALDEQGWALVFGQHVLFEMLKNFPDNPRRGEQLFSYVLSYFSAGLRCVPKDVLDSIAAEMWALKGSDGAGKFLAHSDVVKVSEQIRLLSRGIVKEDWFTHISDQKHALDADRERVKQALDAHPQDLAWLRAVDKADLEIWLDQMRQSALARRILTGHLKAKFPNQDEHELESYAQELLETRARSATSLLRADLYAHWRCAHYGSIRKDFLNDSYHVLTSAYCDAYATGERSQAIYAARLLPSQVSVATLDRQVGIEEWLIGTVAKLRR